MTARTAAAIALMSLLLTPAFAGRIISTPFAETPREGIYRFITSTMEEARSTDKSRESYRLDLALTGDTELGILVVAPEDRPSRTQFNVQHRLTDETASRPTISLGAWDAGHIGRFSGEKTGGSFFIAAGKTVRAGEGRPPVKLSIGAGTNRLDGLFGGVVVPVSRRFGMMAEYLPKNSRMPGADAVNAAVYYYTDSNTRMRLTWSGGNPMLDINISGMFY